MYLLIEQWEWLKLPIRTDYTKTHNETSFNGVTSNKEQSPLNSGHSGKIHGYTHILTQT